MAARLEWVKYTLKEKWSYLTSLSAYWGWYSNPLGFLRLNSWIQEIICLFLSKHLIQVVFVWCWTIIHLNGNTLILLLVNRCRQRSLLFIFSTLNDTETARIGYHRWWWDGDCSIFCRFLCVDLYLSLLLLLLLLLTFPYQVCFLLSSCFKVKKYRNLWTFWRNYKLVLYRGAA